MVFGEAYYESHEIPRCAVEISPYFMISLAFSDIISGIVNSILFIKPVLKLQRSFKDITVTKDLQILTIKQCIYH